jgi:hypothetical protein
MKLDQYFGAIFVVNLAHRKDRRREMEAELARAGIQATFFEAIEPKELGDWPSLGARGCFLSHYSILKRAQEAGLRSVLVLEDDVDFAADIAAKGPELVNQIAGQPWDFLYPGHVETIEAAEGSGLQLVEWHAGLLTTHFYAVNGTALPRVVDFLEQVNSRPNGHPLGGPQHVDGAYSTFRAQNPDVRTLIAWPVLGFQRSSRSDVTLSRLDSLPLIGQTINVARKLRSNVLRRLYG